MTSEEARTRIESEPGFIASKRFNYSLEQLLGRYPEGCPDRIIAAVLLITEDDVEAIYQDIVNKLRVLMGAL